VIEVYVDGVMGVKQTDSIIIGHSKSHQCARYIEMEGGGHVSHIRQRRGKYRVFVWELEGNRPLGRPRHRWEDNIMDFQEVGCGGMDWIYLV
jgi:hypothetical protein